MCLPFRKTSGAFCYATDIFRKAYTAFYQFRSLLSTYGNCRSPLDPCYVNKLGFLDAANRTSLYTASQNDYSLTKAALSLYLHIIHCHVLHYRALSCERTR